MDLNNLQETTKDKFETNYVILMTSYLLRNPLLHILNFEKSSGFGKMARSQLTLHGLQNYQTLDMASVHFSSVALFLMASGIKTNVKESTNITFVRKNEKVIRRSPHQQSHHIRTVVQALNPMVGLLTRKIHSQITAISFIQMIKHQKSTGNQLRPEFPFFISSVVYVCPLYWTKNFTKSYRTFTTQK